MDESGRIVIAGAGAIGCYVGGMLAEAGRDVALLARPRIIDEITRNGLHLTGFHGSDRRIDSQRLLMSDDPAILHDAAFVLVTAKSAATAEIAAAIARYAPQTAIAVSLQNGIGNADVLRQHLPGRKVLAGMVPFNAMARGEGRYHRGSSGDIVIERDTDDTAARLSVLGLNMMASADIVGVQWGKLLVNLSNAINALSGLPLRDLLAQRAWRRVIADQMAEGVAVLKAAGIRPVAATPIPAALMPHLLRLPDALFRIVLGGALTIDPQARSSMSDDLTRGRITEIDQFQGVIVDLAQKHGISTPVSQAIIARIKAAELAKAGSPRLTPDEVAR